METRPRASARLRAFIVVLVAAVGAPMASEALAAGPEVVAAGDIACPDPCLNQRRTARLIRRIDPRAVLTLGDNQYPDGRFADFMDSYHPTWGRFRRRTHPSPGNHEYNSPGARGYFRYFRRRAHRRAGGTYGVRLGKWQLVSINSGNGISARDLRRARRIVGRGGGRCELAFWHHPRWSSSSVHGPASSVGPLWRVLFRQGVDVALNGHDHIYERFALLNPSGRLAGKRGIRQFTVGTGGRSLYRAGPRTPGSQKVIDDRFGVLRLVLHPRSYSWRFVAVGGQVLDRGRRACHR